MRGLKAFALTFVLGGFVALQLSGCSSSSGSLSSGGGNNNPTVASTTPSSTKTAMAVGDTAQGSCTVTMSDGTTNSNCTLSSGNTAVFTVDSTGKITAVGDGTANLVSTSTANMSTGKPATGQLSITVSSAVASVTVSANPTTLTMAQTSTVTVTAAGTGDFNPAVNLTASGGAISNASLNGDVTTATFTPSGTGTATITATSKQDSTKSGSVQVTVTRAAPVITSFTTIGQNWFWCVNDCNKSTISFQIQGIGAQAGDYLNFHGYWPTVSLSASNFSADGKTITVQETINDANQPSGNWIYVDVDPADGTPASNTLAIAYLNFTNSGTFGPSGEVIQKSNSSTAVYLWQLNNGAWSLASQLSLGGPSVVYDVDGARQYLVAGGATYTMSGTLVSSANLPGDMASSNDAVGTAGCVVQPAYGYTSIFTLGVDGGAVSGQTGNLHYDCKVAVINNATYIFAISVYNSSVVWKFDTSGNAVGSQSLTGITSMSDIIAANHMEGNWQLAAIKTGTKAGFFAVLSSYDDAIGIYDGTQNSMPLVKEVSLAPSCILPQAVTAIDAMDQFRVACLVNDGSNSHTSFVGVDLSGNVTSLAATSANFPQGFVADQNNLYVLYGSGAPDSPANK